MSEEKTMPEADVCQQAVIKSEILLLLLLFDFSSKLIHYC